MRWKFEFDECATDKKPTEVEIKDWYNGASYGLRKKTSSIPSFIPHIDFVTSDEFNDVELKTFLFLMYPRVIPELKHVSNTRILILLHFKTQVHVFSKQGKMMQAQRHIYFNLVLFNLESIVFWKLSGSSIFYGWNQVGSSSIGLGSVGGQ